MARRARPHLTVVAVPDVVRNKARTVGAGRWLDGLDDLVAEIERDWQLTVGRAYSDGTEAFVADAELADGTPAVLKLIVPRDNIESVANEINVLRMADGNGCVRLLRADEDRSALLLERLGPALVKLGRPLPERLAILTDTAKRVWRPAPGAGFPTGAEKAKWLADFITAAWDRLDRPCSERAVDHALRCAARRAQAHDDERAVLVHGDVHQWNALQTIDGRGFKLVDPDGLLAEPAADLGVLMREDPADLLERKEPMDRARWLARRTGLDATAIWEWGVVERVSTGLLGTEVDLQPEARYMLAVADRVAD